MVLAYETRAEQAADEALAGLRAAVEECMQAGDYAGAETRLEKGRGLFPYSRNYTGGFDNLQTAMLTAAQQAVAETESRARELMAGHQYDEALA